MKQLLLISCLVVLCASSTQAEDVQQQANEKGKAAKYTWVAMRIGYLGLCVYNLKLIATQKNFSFSKEHTQFNKIFFFSTGFVVAKSLYNDFTK